MRREMGSETFNCQYQQNPIVPDGSPLRWEWFRAYEVGADRNWYQAVIQSWDTGMSADPRADFSVCTTWGFRENNWYLLDVWRGQLDYPDLKSRTLALVEQWDPDRVLIEDAATGRSLFDELFRDDWRRYERIRPENDKETRFRSSLAPVEEGKVFLPKEAPWLPVFKRELQSFPRGRNDDQVDSFSQLVNWSKGNGIYRALGREHPINIERRERQRRRR
nr:phage terminase large subunit [Cognatiyoonia sediminum]